MDSQILLPFGGSPVGVLFDEPLSNLDAKLRDQVRTEIRALQRRVGFTAVYVTHDQAEALAMSDTVFLLNKGVIMMDHFCNHLIKLKYCLQQLLIEPNLDLPTRMTI